MSTIDEVKALFETADRPSELDFGNLIDRCAKGTLQTNRITHPLTNDTDYNIGDRYLYTPDGLTYEIISGGDHQVVNTVSYEQVGDVSPGHPASRTTPGLHFASNGDIYVTDGATFTLLDIAGNTISIAANAANIASNDTDIATNAAGISTNVTDIGTNAGDIATNVTNIGTNATNIATNVTNIGTNAADISTNLGNIATNTGNIATNTADIAAIGATAIGYDTRAEMVATSPALGDGTVITLRGFYVVGDTLPWLFRYRASGRPVAEGGFGWYGSDVDDWWEALDKTIAHVDRFGAKPNDSTFDSQPAISAAIHAGAPVVEFAKDAIYTLVTTEGLLEAMLVIDWEQNGITLNGNGSTLRIQNNVAGLPANVFGVLQFYARDGNTTQRISVNDLICDANQPNNTGSTIACFQAVEVAPGDFIEHIRYSGCTALNTGPGETNGAGFTIIGGNIFFHDCEARDCTTGFGMKDTINDIGDRYFEGSHLRCYDCEGVGFNWSGDAGDGSGGANGNFSNLLSMRCGQNKVDGSWNLNVTNWFDFESIRNPFGCGDHQRVNIVNCFFIDGGYRVSVGPSTSSHAHFSMTNCEILRGAKALPASNDLLNVSGSATLKDVYIDCDNVATQKGAILGASVNVDGLTVVNCAGLPAVWAVAGTGISSLKNITTTGTTGSYSLYVQRNNTTLEKLNLDVRMLYPALVTGAVIKDTDFSSITGAAVFGENGQEVEIIGCRNISLEADIVPNIVYAHVTATDAQLLAVGDPINTGDKRLPKPVWATTSSRMVYASGALASDVWTDQDGTTVFSPV